MWGLFSARVDAWVWEDGCIRKGLGKGRVAKSRHIDGEVPPCHASVNAASLSCFVCFSSGFVKVTCAASVSQAAITHGCLPPTGERKITIGVQPSANKSRRYTVLQREIRSGCCPTLRATRRNWASEYASRSCTLRTARRRRKELLITRGDACIG